MHGGTSRGPVTPEGLARSLEALRRINEARQLRRDGVTLGVIESASDHGSEASVKLSEQPKAAEVAMLPVDEGTWH